VSLFNLMYYLVQACRQETFSNDRRVIGAFFFQASKNPEIF